MENQIEIFKADSSEIEIKVQGELVENSVCKDFLHTAEDGKQYKTTFYNLDVIISVGYRVKSLRGTQFRQWATQRLKDYLVQGYAINQKRLKQLEQVVQIVQQSGSSKELSSTEVKGLLEIITSYTQSLFYLTGSTVKILLMKS